MLALPRCRLLYPRSKIVAFFVITVAIATMDCSSGTQSFPYSGPLTTSVRLPDGTDIKVELAVTPQQQARGLMFRSYLSPDRGMLFMFSNEKPRPFWMYNTLIPLDIIWAAADRRIVFISTNTPPCTSLNQAECPNYGEGLPAQYVLELAAGQAIEHNLKVGEQLSF